MQKQNETINWKWNKGKWKGESKDKMRMKKTKRKLLGETKKWNEKGKQKRNYN